MSPLSSHIFHPTSLREYDIRGIIGETLGEADAYAIGRGFATLIARAGGKKVVVGYDGRLSSPMLEEALVSGLNDSGIDVVRIGMGPTPMLYYAEAVLDEVDGGIEITGSHNPANYNGFKLVFQGRPFFGSDIQLLGSMAASGDWAVGKGSFESHAILNQYVDRLSSAAPSKPFRIGWDAGNGAAGPVIEQLVKMLPGEHHLLFVDVDGQFPNHHPDPTDENNLIDLRALVAEKKLDFGVAFDAMATGSARLMAKDA
jgi:phosphomannomutase